jgi:tRNA(Ile)-lysidine synthase
MAASPTPKPTPSAEWRLDDRLQAALESCDGLPGPLGVACSGGADSVALLLAAHQRWSGQVTALHVNHGLQAAAADFERFVVDVCMRLGVPLWVRSVAAAHRAGESPEDAARQARYRALADMAQTHGLSHVLLAQHADDQAETLLLALSRGAGVSGLAGMPVEMDRHGVRFVRPWLTQRSADLRAWLQTQGQAWCEDPSNQDTRYTRNRLRHTVLPALDTQFPGFVACVARSAAHCAQADGLLDELAQIDLLQTGSPPTIAGLQALSDARLANALRHWLRTEAGRTPSTAQLHELMAQIRDCRTRGHRIAIKVGAGQVRREGSRLAYLPPL